MIFAGAPATHDIFRRDRAEIDGLLHQAQAILAVSPSTIRRMISDDIAPTRDEVCQLAIEAGFAEVDVRVSRQKIRLPRVDRFAPDHLAATPVAAVVATAEPEARRTIGEIVSEQLHRFADGDGVVYPEETYVLTAEVA